MEDINRRSSIVRFGFFEVDLQAGELHRQGRKVKLQEQPFQVLVILLKRAGEVVTREDLQKALWPADTFVDFERGLNRAINKLREALGDDPDSPRFIETLPRRGYRFIAGIDAASAQEEEAAGTNRLLLAPVGTHQVEDTVSKVAFPTRQSLPWVIVAVLAAAGAIGFRQQWRFTASVADRPFYQLDLEADPDGFSQPAISPDGMRIVFVAKRGLIIRRLDQTKTTALAGTEGASYPFFSPNGQSVAFFGAGKLQKVAVEGGTPIPLCDAPGPGGGTWETDDSIVAALDRTRGLFRVPATGGAPQPLTDPREDPSGILMHRWPQALPGGGGILFAATNASMQGSLRVLAPNGKLRTVVANSTYGRILPSGYVVYSQRETLYAAPWDTNRLEITGPAVPLVHAVSKSGDRADFDLSNSGTLVYRSGTTRNSVPSWLYSSGKVEPALAKPGNYVSPRLSPDGARLAISMIREGKQSLWVYDLSRETWTRLTSDNYPELLPTWTPDGEYLAFRSGDTLAWTHSDGSGKVQRLAGFSRNAGPWSFSADGKWLAFWPLEPDSHLWTVPVERTPGMLRLGQPQLLLQQAGSKGAPAISPDDRWLAYTSDASGRFEVYVMPFSPRGRVTDRKWPVSNGGGHSPVWSHDGRELFYEGPDHRIQAAAYRVAGDSFVAEKPRFWSGKQMADIGFFPAFDVGPDGKRVLALVPSEDAKPETILRVVLNVDSELRRRAPTRGR
ncbi:MAG TPA: winged helix-turn-helix domain-containing protein [Candidatus Acidoferrum sp.]|nr:winged helix-turn-helix domain-containing protein [Candidatus Acidoferrum sp.]